MLKKEELRGVFEKICWHSDRAEEYYGEYMKFGNEIMASIISTTDNFKKSKLGNAQALINRPIQEYYSEESILEELKRFPIEFYYDLLMLSILYCYEEPYSIKWISLVLKVKEDELKSFVESNPYLLLDVAQYGLKEILKQFIEKGVDVTISPQGFESNAAIHYAAWRGQYEIVKMLLDAGAEISEPTAKVAVESGDIKTIQFLVDAGANYKTGFAREAICYATEQGWVEIVKILLEAGADPCVKGHYCFNFSYKKAKKGKKCNRDKYSKIYEMLNEYLKKQILIASQQD